MRLFRCFAIGLSLALAAASADAQFTQFTRPGKFDRSPVAVKTELDAAIEDAKWDLGRVRADPWFALRELTYDDNVGRRSDESQSDFTATIGAGVRAYLPFGSDMILAAHLLPEYVWWKEFENRRQLNGRAGVGIFGTAGKTTLEASVSRIDEARFFSREFEDQVNTSDEIGFLSLEVDLGRGYSLFGSGRLRRLEFSDDDVDVDVVKTLDRDETIYRAGARYKFKRGLTLSLGVEDSDVEFEEVDSVRSNSGTAPLLLIDYVAPDFFIVLEAAGRDLEFEFAPEQLNYEEVTGELRGEWAAFDRAAFQAYTRRDLVYSFTDRWAYFDETASGVGLRISATSWLAVRLFAESGNADFAPISPEFPMRDDDFDGYGIEFQFEVRRATFHLDFSTTDYTSTLPEFDREVTVIRSGLVFGSRTASPWS
jgi:hypothetical protein